MRRHVLVLFLLAATSFAQAPRRPGTLPPAPPLDPDSQPILANICPKFVLQGTPRRVKFYGANFADVQIEYEGEDLLFRDLRVDPDNRSFSVVVEATRTSEAGRRVLTLTGQQNPQREALIYILKREDRALLHRDLNRCAWMKDEVELSDPQRRPPE